MFRRIYAIFQARNREFVRDRGSLSWNLILPIALMFGLSFAFSNERDAYTVGVLQEAAEIRSGEHSFLQTKFIKFIAYDDFDLALRKIARHQLDLLVEFGDRPKYWINPESPKGYKLEGEVDFEAVVDTVEAITPVPGGVGPMTIAMLMTNVVRAAGL